MCAGEDKKNEEDKTPSGKSIVRTPEQRARRALAKFIASFREGTGVSPPTRSWRNLLVLSDFSPYIEKIKKSQKEIDIANVKTEMKVFKNALNDLISLSKSAVQSLDKAVTTQLNKKRMKDSGSKSPAQKQQQVARTMMDSITEKGTPMEAKQWTSFAVPASDVSTLFQLVLAVLACCKAWRLDTMIEGRELGGR